jgi:hypothetical protein
MQVPLFKPQTEWLKPEERVQLNLFDEEEEVFLQDFKFGIAACTYCKKELPIKAFGTTLGGKIRRSMCKECDSKHTKIIEKLYLSSPPKPDNCECCGIKPKIITNKKKYSNLGILQLDHTHDDDPKFRGWVCGRCNQGLGKLGDNLKGVIKAALYLSENNTALILKTIKNI